MNIKELIAHVNDNVQNGRDAGAGLAWAGVPSSIRSASDIDWSHPHNYSTVAKRVLINGIECVAGMTEAPEMGGGYVIANPIPESLYTSSLWTEHAIDHRYLKLGLVFPKTKEGIANAAAMGKAMISFKQVEG